MDDWRHALQTAMGQTIPRSESQRPLLAQQRYVRGSEMAIINRGGQQSGVFLMVRTSVRRPLRLKALEATAPLAI